MTLVDASGNGGTGSDGIFIDGYEARG